MRDVWLSIYPVLAVFFLGVLQFSCSDQSDDNRLEEKPAPTAVTAEPAAAETTTPPAPEEDIASKEAFVPPPIPENVRPPIPGTQGKQGSELDAVVSDIARKWAQVQSLRAAVELESRNEVPDSDMMSIQQGNGSYEILRQNGEELFRAELGLEIVSRPSEESGTEEYISSVRLLKVYDGDAVYQEITPLGSPSSDPTVVKGGTGDFSSFLAPGGIGQHPLALLQRYAMPMRLLPEKEGNGATVYLLEVSFPQAPETAAVTRFVCRFARETGALLRIDYYRGEEQVGHVAMNSLEINPELDASRFTYSPPAGSDVKELEEASGVKAAPAPPAELPPPPGPRIRDPRLRGTR